MSRLRVKTSRPYGVGSGLLEHPLAGTGFLHLLTHGVQVVGDGDDWEKQRQQTDQRDDRLERAGATPDPEAKCRRE